MDLRPYRREDKPALVKLFGDPLVMQYSSNGAPLKARDAERLFAKIFEIYKSDPQFHIWAIEESGAYVGHAELKRRQGRSEYELVYFLSPDVWGRGVGSGVVDGLLEEARTLRLPFVIATVDDRNERSLAILRRRGFAADNGLSQELGAPAYRLQL